MKFETILAFILFILLLPLLTIFYFLVKITSKGPFIFKQKRMGKDMRVFTIYKIRTMVNGAEKLKDKYKNLNQYKAPIFKIHNDPRYTSIGKILAKTGLDEILQLINIMKGDMSFVGPRPLPVSEAEKIQKKYIKRFSILPGIIPPWIMVGTKALTTNLWLELELKYMQNKSIKYDVQIFLQGLRYLFNSL